MVLDGQKTATAYLLGLIDEKTYQFLNGLREYRNNCAHYPGELHLDDPSVNKLISHLKPEAIGAANSATEKTGDNRILFGPRHLAGEFSDARLKLMMACAMVYHEIMMKGNEFNPACKGRYVGVGLGGFQFSLESLHNAGILPQEETPPIDSPG